MNWDCFKSEIVPRIRKIKKRMTFDHPLFYLSEIIYGIL